MIVCDWIGIINDYNGRLIGYMNVFFLVMLMINIYYLCKEWYKNNWGFSDFGNF